MKKIILMILLLITISNVSYSQLTIGPRIKLRDSSGVLVISAPIKLWSNGWIKSKDIDSSLAGSGISYGSISGLNVNVGNGIYVENDTLKASLFTRIYTDSISITKSNTSPFLRFSNTNTNEAFLKLNEENLIKLSPSKVTIEDSLSVNEFHITNSSGTMLYVDADIAQMKGFDGNGYTPSSESYYGDGSSVMTGPYRWVKVVIDGIELLIPLYIP